MHRHEAQQPYAGPGVDACTRDIPEAARFLAAESGAYFLAEDGAATLATRLRRGDTPD